MVLSVSTVARSTRFLVRYGFVSGSVTLRVWFVECAASLKGGEDGSTEVVSGDGVGEGGTESIHSKTSANLLSDQRSLRCVARTHSRSGCTARIRVAMLAS